MKRCYNCNQNISDVDVCPICGGEMKQLLEDDCENAEKDISIELDFTVDNCVKCGDLLLYNHHICKKCGAEKEIFVNDIDPKVKVRKEKFQVITELINNKNAHIKNLRKNIHRGIENKVFYENFLDLVQPKISELNELSLKNLYKNISFKSEVIESIETKDKVQEIKKYIENIYEIYESLLIIDPPYAWKNIYNRLCSAVQKLLDSNKAIISSLVAETIEKAFTNNKFAQDKLNEATEDILLVDNMFGIKSLELNFDLIKDGNINKSLAIIMMIGSKNDNADFGITEQYNKMQVNGYNYFKDCLQYDLDHYIKLDNPVLLKLCSYRFMSIYSFSENDFIEKTKIVINALEKAKTKNFTELKSFIDKFESKYIYATKVLNQVFQDYIMYLSYCKDEKLLIRNAMKWYKDLSEGVYRDIVSLLIACGNILDKKELDYNNILEWLGFGDKFDYMNNKKKLRFDKLTEGVEKIIRHSEAHVDFEVDNYNQKVILRNKISKEKLINEKTYTYEEFFLVQVKLQETIFSIVTGLEIFMINNYIDFKYFLADIEQEMKINEGDEYESTFSLIGITNINKKEIIEDNKKILLINGTSIYRTDKELFSKCISCTAPIIKNRNDIDIIRIELEDIDSIEIGSVEVITKYIKESYSVIDKFKKYQLLLSLKTTKINYFYNEDTELEDNYGFKFIFAILQWFLELVKLLNGRRNNIDTLKEIRDELSYSIKVLQEYKLFRESYELIDYTCNMINYFIQGINTELEGILNINAALISKADSIYRDTCFKIASISGTHGEDQSIKKLLLTDFLNKNKIGRNNLCPCGSGKKYKKCCMKN